jgi:hypothetical protein
MNTETISHLLQQLAYQLPALFIFVAGGIAAAVSVRRHRASSVLCLVGCVVSLLTIFAITGIQAWLFGARQSEGWTMARYGQAMSLVAMAGAVLRPIGLALILVAVFIGRKQPASS